MAKSQTWSAMRFIITRPSGSVKSITVCGRDRGALEFLITAGENGCTPIDTPGPRWSGYVHNLRRMCVDIETINEPHDGPFSGTHARYILRSTVTRDQSGEAA